MSKKKLEPNGIKLKDMSKDEILCSIEKIVDTTKKLTERKDELRLQLFKLKYPFKRGVTLTAIYYL